jgi:hypothetical protein
MRSSAVYPNASAPIRAMPISASFSLASSRRFATWTSSAILLPFGAHRTTSRHAGAVIALRATPYRGRPNRSGDATAPVRRVKYPLALLVRSQYRQLRDGAFMEPSGRNRWQPDLMEGAADGGSTVVAFKRRGSIVVDDQVARRHPISVANTSRRRIGANRNPTSSASRAATTSPCSCSEVAGRSLGRRATAAGLAFAVGSTPHPHLARQQGDRPIAARGRSLRDYDRDPTASPKIQIRTWQAASTSGVCAIEQY